MWKSLGCSSFPQTWSGFRSLQALSPVPGKTIVEKSDRARFSLLHRASVVVSPVAIQGANGRLWPGSTKCEPASLRSNSSQERLPISELVAVLHKQRWQLACPGWPGQCCKNLDWIRKLSRAKKEKSQGLTKEAAALRALRASLNSLSLMMLPNCHLKSCQTSHWPLSSRSCW